MGNHVHFALVSEPPLLAELGRASTVAIALRDEAPLLAFVRANAGRFPRAVARAKRAPAYEELLRACAVDGPASDVGLGDVGALWAADLEQGFIDPLLYDVPSIDEDTSPSDALFARCLERFGHYSARDAGELLREDAWATCGYFYMPPTWAEGAGLRVSATRVKRTQAKLRTWRLAEPRDAYDTERAREMEGRLARLEDAVRKAARDGRAVVEWVHKL